MTAEELTNGLKKYLPEEAAQHCADLMIRHNAHLRINRERKSKMGDYRAPYHGGKHRITVNHNLNRYAFLITLLHEFAHLHTWNMHKDKVMPHGREWKHQFLITSIPFIRLKIFPEDVEAALIRYMKNPAASSCSDDNLHRVLKRYDEKNHFTFLEELPQGARFKLKGYSNTWIKGEQLRKYFTCTDADDKKLILRISPVAEVVMEN